MGARARAHTHTQLCLSCRTAYLLQMVLLSPLLENYTALLPAQSPPHKHAYPACVCPALPFSSFSLCFSPRRNSGDLENYKTLMDEATYYDKQWNATWEGVTRPSEKSTQDF